MGQQWQPALYTAWQTEIGRENRPPDEEALTSFSRAAAAEPLCGSSTCASSPIYRRTSCRIALWRSSTATSRTRSRPLTWAKRRSKSRSSLNRSHSRLLWLWQFGSDSANSQRRPRPGHPRPARVALAGPTGAQPTVGGDRNPQDPHRLWAGAPMNFWQLAHPISGRLAGICISPARKLGPLRSRRTPR